MSDGITPDDIGRTAQFMLSKARAMYRLTQAAWFTDAIAKANQAERKLIMIYINNNDWTSFKKLVEKKRDELVPVEQMSLRKLRRIASALKVSYYTRLPRSELIRAVKELRDEKDPNATGDSRDASVDENDHRPCET